MILNQNQKIPIVIWNHDFKSNDFKSFPTLPMTRCWPGCRRSSFRFCWNVCDFGFSVDLLDCFSNFGSSVDFDDFNVPAGLEPMVPWTDRRFLAALESRQMPGVDYQVRRLDTEKLEVEGASSPLRYRLLMTEVDYHLPSRSQRFFRPLWVTFTNQLSNKLHRTNVTGATKPRQSHKASSVALLTY